MTVRDFLDGQWLPAIESTVRSLTFTQYRSVVRLRLVPALGHLRLQQLGPGHVNTVYRELEQQGLSVATRRSHAVLHRALRDAVRWGLLVRNPATDPPAQARARWRRGQQRARPLPRARLATTVCIHSGVSPPRRACAAGSSWASSGAHLNLDGARISNSSSNSSPREAVSRWDRRNQPRSRRTVALDEENGSLILRDHREAQLLRACPTASDAYVDHDLVFADELGGPIHPQRLTEWFGNHQQGSWHSNWNIARTPSYGCDTRPDERDS